MRPVTGQAAWAITGRLVLLLVLAVVAVWLVITLQQVLLQLLLAVILTTGIRPLVDRLRRQGFSRTGSVLIIYLLLLIALMLIGLIIVPPIASQIEDVVRHAPMYGDMAVELLRDLRVRFPALPPLDEQLQEQVRNLGGQLGQVAAQAANVARFALGIFSGLLSMLLILLITLYLTVDGERIRDYFLSFLPAGQHTRMRAVTDRVGERMGGWLVGQVALSIVIGAVCYVGLSVLGIKSAALLAVLAAIGEAVPVIGPIASAVPAVLVAFTQSTWQGVATLVLYVIVQQLENNILVPKIMERAVALHPLAVVTALLVGSELLGVIGAIISVPVAAALAVLLNELRSPESVAPAPPDEIDARLVEARPRERADPAEG